MEDLKTESTQPRQVIACANKEEVQRLIEQHCDQTITQFSQFRHGKNFGKGMSPLQLRVVFLR